MKQPKAQPMGPKAVRGSDAARRAAALLLEVWSGVRTAQSASEAMAVAVTRFYQLEARALQLMVTAMEPRPRGRQKTAESELGKLKAEQQRLRREAERYQSLYRTAQRALGLAVVAPKDKPENPAPNGKRRRGPRKTARGQAVAVVLSQPASANSHPEVSHGATEQGSGPRGRPAGRGAAEAAAAVHP